MIDLTKIQENLNVKFQNPDLLKIALTHRSFLNEDKNSIVSNERLEFLGDSVLSLLVSTELYNRFKNYPEGKLTYLRSLLVKTKTLGDLAKKLQLGEHLLISRGEEKTGGRENSSLLADTFEAFLGALYIDSGLDRVKDFLTEHLFPLIKEVETDIHLLDFKSTLQEKTQSLTKLSPDYKVVQSTGPDHNKMFTVSVSLGEKMLAKGSGKSKQEAEQDAAKLALEGSEMLK